MTNRVFNCHRGGELVWFRSRRGTPRPPRRGRLPATLAIVALTPIVGAADQPLGWLSAVAGGLMMLVLHEVLGRRAPWGVLVWLTGCAAMLVPPQPEAPLGPGLLVACAVSGVLWLVHRAPGDRASERLPVGSPEREAQEAMGRSGEQHVRLALARELPDEYVLINGLMLPRGAGDIDHLVVGPTGVFLIETKTMAGHIVCEPDGSWRRTKVGRSGTPYSAFIGNPAAQVHRNVLAVRDCLRERTPRLFQGTPLWVEGLVVFPHPRTELSAEHSQVPAVRLDEATQRICSHVPRRGLGAEEVDQVVGALLVAARERGQVAALSAQALVEMAMALPIVLVLLFGTLGLSRVVQAHSAVVTLAHEVARAGALGGTPEDALDRMRTRADQVANNLRLDTRVLEMRPDVSAFGRQQGRVRASVRYTVDLNDVPMVGWVAGRLSVRAEHVEWIDPFRSGIRQPDGASP